MLRVSRGSRSWFIRGIPEEERSLMSASRISLKVSLCVAFVLAALGVVSISTAVAQTPAASKNVQWVSIGPRNAGTWGGKANAFAYVQSNPNIMYLGGGWGNTPRAVSYTHLHGLVGRRYAGEVKQIITGSIGFDDWEWGVDLFADDPLVFKKLIYEMRFDHVSAVYALFGSFYIGLRCPANRLYDLLEGNLPQQIIAPLIQ